MDEFSWFVGIYEGEGSMYSRRYKKRHTLVSGEKKEYDATQVCLTIKMTDEDTIARVATFLGQKYAIVEKNRTDKLGWKTLYRVRQTGGPNGKLRKLLDRMRPHLSKRRQEQMDHHLR